MQSFQLLEERVHSLTVQQHEQAQQLQAMPQKMMKDLEEKLIRLDPGTPTQHKYSDNTLNKKDEEGATGGSELGSPEPSGTEFQRNRTPFTQDRSFPQYIKFQEFSQMEGPLSIRL
ncbi:hypothetical protein V1264_024544 [Littorina saxatilis]|uniref:Uncharacterized protein n=2 Tax=Littorina saxatilis TaxID=31220 RepID=A0AAN9ALC2_9CAEN